MRRWRRRGGSKMRTAALIKGRHTLVAHVAIASQWGSRARGLLGTRRLPPGHGLYLVPCRAIHTCFMRYALDLIFLDAEQQVVSLVLDVRPWRMVRGGHRARAVLEMQSGWFPRDILAPGDQVAFAFHEASGSFFDRTAP